MTGETTVHIVDDDDAVRDSLSALIEVAGIKVAGHRSGLAFLNAISSASSGCVLLDVRMPNMDGLEVQRRLIEAGHSLPVVMITGHADVPLAVKAMRAGAFDFVEKPVRADVILDIIARALEAGRKAQSKDASTEGIESRLATLTPRERQVLEQLVIGNQNKSIAHGLGISPRTVEIHRARVMDKMAAKSLSHLVRMALSVGLDPGAAAD